MLLYPDVGNKLVETEGSSQNKRYHINCKKVQIPKGKHSGANTQEKASSAPIFVFYKSFILLPSHLRKLKDYFYIPAGQTLMLQL